MLNVGGKLFLLAALLSLPAMAQVSGPQAVSGEYIVKFRNTKTGAGLKVISKLGSSVSLKAVFAGSQMMHVKVNSEAAKNALYANPEVDFIEPNYILSVNPQDLSALGSPPDSNDDYIQSNSNVQVKDSWAIAKPYNQGTKTVIAIIDTGLDRTHGLFADSGAIWENTAEKNGVAGVDDDGNGYIDDINGWNFNANTANVNDDNDHGTHVAGIVLGVGQDVVATPVRESKIKIMPLKFLDANGSGSTSAAVSAIYYAVSRGAKVINNSWGGASYSQSLHEAYTYAYDHGVVIVSAAGNSNSNNDSADMYPANLDTPNNISVASTTDADARSSFSNYGAAKVHVAAPGSGILSSVPGTGCIAPGCFQMMSGTSMASPFVAGMAALILREAPQLSAYQVKQIILATVDPIASLANKVSSGGRVNVYKAITSAISQSATASWTPSYAPDYKSSRSTASDSLQNAAPSGCGLVKAFIDGGGSGGAGGGGAAEAGDIALVLCVMLLPLVVAFNLRDRAEKSLAERRAFDRFAVSKTALLNVSDQLINITTDDISLGGISFKADMGLTKGQIIGVQFSDNAEQVQAEVVWCSTKQVYGLRFMNVSDGIKNQIQSWTRGLVPSN